MSRRIAPIWVGPLIIAFAIAGLAAEQHREGEEAARPAARGSAAEDDRLILETPPALNRMQPFSNLQLAQAVCLARFLADYGQSRIPAERQFLVRRLSVVGVCS
jgi:hypothetical protein